MLNEQATENEKKRTILDTSPTNDESISIDELQYLARTISRAQKLNQEVESLIRRTSPSSFENFYEALLDIHKISSRLVLLVQPALLVKEKGSLAD